MNRDEKAAVIDEIAAQIEGSDAIFAIDYRGISVPEAAVLRGNLREADASFRIVKNRLTKLAAERAGREELKGLLEGPTALAFIRGDTATAAKAISTFNRERDVLVFKGGFMDGLALDEETFTSIARLPSRDVLNGQFAGVVASPLTGLVRGLGSMVSGLAVALQQIADQGLVSGEPPARAEAAEPAPAGDPDAPGSEAEDASGGDSGDTSSSQAAGEEPSPAPPAEGESEPSAEAEAAEPEAEAAEPEAPEPEPASDPDTPGSGAEDVSGSDSKTSDEPETANEEE
jgi:large subunit ribosomal protein L10